MIRPGVAFRLRVLVVTLCTSVLSLAGYAAPAKQPANPPKLPATTVNLNGHPVNPARVLVRWKDPTSSAASIAQAELALRTEDAQVLGAQPTRIAGHLYSTLNGVGVLEFDDAADVQTALRRGELTTTSASVTDALSINQLKSRMAALKASGLFEYVEPDYIQRAYAVPSDAGFGDGRLWGLRNTGQSGGVSGIDAQVVDAWDITTGSDQVIVAVIDTGIRHSHLDLAPNMWRNPGETAGNGVDDDGNGIVDDVFGFNAITGSGDPMDDNGHGSHCAGTIGGSANDAGELVGVAWTVKLMGLKFLNADGGGNLSDAIKCIDYAVAKGAHIISGSYGGGGYSQATADSIERARQAGILCIFAAGNETNNNDNNPAYPASYPHNNIVSVAAIDRTGALATFSNHGATSVDIAAPGVAIFSCNFQNDSAYQTISGTSMATPHVAGVAALLKAKNSGDDYVTLRQRLLGSTRALTALQGRVATGGMVQARAAMDLSADGTMEVSLSVTPSPLRAGEPATFIARVTDLGPVTTATVTGTLGTTSIVFRNDGVAPDTRAADELYTARVTVPETAAGTLPLTINATAAGKNDFSASVNVSVITSAGNDNFGSAATLDLAAVPVQTSNVDASRESGEPAHAGNLGGRSLWWTWTAPSSGTMQISTTGSSFDTLLAVYTGSTLNALTLVAANDDASGSTLQSAVEFTATAGTAYKIGVDGFNGASGNIVLNATFTSSGGGATPPAFARQPSSLRVQQGETIRLSAEVSGSPAPSLQWTFNGTPLSNGGRVSGAQSSELVITSAQASDGGNYALVATNSAGTATSLTAVVTVDVALIRPPNDNFANRLALVGASAQATGSNTGATAESGEPAHADVTAHRSVWWTWTAPQTGTVSIDTFGSAFDTVLAVYRGTSVSTLTSVSSNNDSGASRQSRVSFTAEAGVQYAIAIDSAATDSGAVTLRLLQGTAGGEPPVIMRQPVDTPVLEGFGATLTIVATGSEPLTYQWWKDGSPLEDEDTATLSIDRSQLADAGNYYVIVSNPNGSTTSETATLEVAATGRPPNDDFAAAAPISFGGEIIVARLTGATRETGERSHGSAESRGGTMWWRWSPLQSGTAVITTDGSITESGNVLDTVVAVYTGTSLNDLTLVAENDDVDLDAGDYTSEVSFFANAGTTYFIAVGGYDVDDVGIIILEVPFAATPASAAAPVVLLHPLTTTIAVGESATFIVGSSGAPNPGIRWQRSTDGGATWSDLTDGGGVTGAEELILEIANAQESHNGERYRARLSNSAGTVTSNAAMITVLPRPGNDDLSNAITIPAGSGAATGVNVGATIEVDEPDHAGIGEASVWWTWQAGVTGPATIDTLGSDYDTVLAVYTGSSVGALTEIASNDDFGDALQSRVEFNAVAGTTYRIAVAGYFGSYGSIKLSVPSDLSPALTVNPPSSTRVTQGGTVTISASATGSPAPSFQWQRSTDGGSTWNNLANDGSFSGVDSQTLSIAGAAAGLNGQLFRVVATNNIGSVTSSASALTVSNPAIQLTNISTRAISLAGDSVIIPGFVISGSGTKRLLIRAIGPKLLDLGVTSATMPDPVLSIFQQGQPTAIAVNDDWVTQDAGRPSPATVGLEVGAFALTAGEEEGPTDDSVSAAIVLDLPAGAYSTVARDKLDRTGIGMVEVYDVDDPNTGGPRLVNVSNRGFVGTGDQVMIPGIVVHGSGARRYLIRAVGPKLFDLGVPAPSLLVDPRLSVRNHLGAIVASNDDWVVQTEEAGGTAADVQTLSAQVGAFSLESNSELPLDDQKSAALVVWLEPGSYTVLVSGADGGTGVALAEVYEVP